MMPLNSGVRNDEDDVDYVVENVILGDKKDLSIVVRRWGRKFHIEIRPENLREPMNQSNPTTFELEYLGLVENVDNMLQESPSTSENDSPRDNSSLKDIHDNTMSSSHESFHRDDPLLFFGLQPFLKHHIFQRYASAASTPFLSTLRDRLWPPTLSFTVKVEKGELIPIELSIDQTRLHRGPQHSYVFNSVYFDTRGWPATVKSEDILLADRSIPQNPDLVIFQSRLAWFKAVHIDRHESIYVREIDTLLHIEKKKISSRIRVPKLLALVTSESDYTIYGMLLTAIHPNRGTVADRIHNDDAPIALRKRWFNDIKRMLNILHDSDLIWGDFKPDNMLIDQEDNVWMIDFGGGRTEGWVDFEHMHTKEGDLEGLKRFKKFLDLK